MLIERNTIGATSEALVSGYLCAQGFEVFAATQSHSRADLVYVNENEAIRVQVKTSSCFERNGLIYEQCRLVRKGINIPYTSEEVDEIWIVGTHLWRFPLEVVESLSSITLLSSRTATRKTTRLYNPNDYILIHGNFERPYRDRFIWSETDPPLLLNNYSYAPSVQARRKDS